MKTLCNDAVHVHSDMCSESSVLAGSEKVVRKSRNGTEEGKQGQMVSECTREKALTGEKGISLLKKLHFMYDWLLSLLYDVPHQGKTPVSREQQRPMSMARRNAG